MTSMCSSVVQDLVIGYNFYRNNLVSLYTVDVYVIVSNNIIIQILRKANILKINKNNVSSTVLYRECLLNHTGLLLNYHHLK